MRTLTVACIWACLGLAGCKTWVAPVDFPDFKYVDAKPLVVVADVRPGGYLPEFDECKRKDVICLHDPLWLKVTVREALYGQAPASRMIVTTTSHYGLDDYESNHAPRLMLLTVGPHGDVSMPTYANYALARRSDGTWFLPADISNVAWFLPCSITALQEPIDPKQFPSSLAMDPEEDTYRIEQNPELFQTLDGKIYPRYAIAIPRIRDTLNRERPQATAMECEWTIDKR